MKVGLESEECSVLRSGPPGLARGMVAKKENGSSLGKGSSKGGSSLAVMKAKAEEKSDVGADFRGGRDIWRLLFENGREGRPVEKGYISSACSWRFPVSTQLLQSLRHK